MNQMTESDYFGYTCPTLRRRTVAALLAHAKQKRAATESYWNKLAYCHEKLFTYPIQKETAQAGVQAEQNMKQSLPDLHSARAYCLPPFSFSGKNTADDCIARMRETVVKNICRQKGLAEKAAVNERRSFVLGSAVWKVVPILACESRDITVENPSPYEIFPDPESTSVDACDYIAHLYRVPNEQVKSLWWQDRLKRPPMETSLNGVSAYEMTLFGQEENGMSRITEWWFRQPEDGTYTDTVVTKDGYLEERTVCFQSGDIALCVFVNGREVRYIPNYYEKTACIRYPFVICPQNARDDSIWGRSAIEAAIPLVGTALSVMASRELCGKSLFHTDVENKNASSLASPNELWNRYAAFLRRSHILQDMEESTALSRKSDSYARLYRLLDAAALEFFGYERLLALGADAYGLQECEDCIDYYGYVPLLNVRVEDRPTV